jgi:hypothetical protein
MPWLLYPQGKSPWYPLDRGLGGPQSQSGHCGEEKIPQYLPGIEPLIIQPVAQHYTTELNYKNCEVQSKIMQIYMRFINMKIMFSFYFVTCIQYDCKFILIIFWTSLYIWQMIFKPMILTSWF